MRWIGGFGQWCASSPSRRPLIKNLRPFLETSDQSADLKCPQIFDFLFLFLFIFTSQNTDFNSKSVNMNTNKNKNKNLRPLLDYN